MLGLLYRILIGRFSRCDHKWATIHHGALVGLGGAKTGDYYHPRCEKCGDIVVRNLR
jgi:hypothetical protein